MRFQHDQLLTDFTVHAICQWMFLYQNQVIGLSLLWLPWWLLVMTYLFSLWMLRLLVVPLTNQRNIMLNLHGAMETRRQLVFNETRSGTKWLWGLTVLGLLLIRGWLWTGPPTTAPTNISSCIHFLLLLDFLPKQPPPFADMDSISYRLIQWLQLAAWLTCLWIARLLHLEYYHRHGQSSRNDISRDQPAAESWPFEIDLDDFEADLRPTKTDRRRKSLNASPVRPNATTALNVGQSSPNYRAVVRTNMMVDRSET